VRCIRIEPILVGSANTDDHVFFKEQLGKEWGCTLGCIGKSGTLYSHLTRETWKKAEDVKLQPQQAQQQDRGYRTFLPILGHEMSRILRD